MRYLTFVSPLAAVLALSACTPSPAGTQNQATAATPPVDPPAPAAAPARVTGGPAPAHLAVSELGEARFTGFGNMRLGSSLEEAKAAWGGELRGAPVAGASCHYLLPQWAKDRRELGFMIEDGRFVRYDVGSSKLAAPGGGKVGMGLDALTALYHGALQAAPHKYVEGGQTLSLEASGVGPARLVFEVDAAGKVTAWRVGLAPQVDYVEGCA